MSFVDEFDDLMIHEVELTTMRAELLPDGRINRWVPNPPVKVRGVMKALDSIEVRRLDLTGVEAAWRFICAPGWAGGLNSTIRYDGRELVQSGEVLPRPGLDMDHDEVLLVQSKAVNRS